MTTVSLTKAVGDHSLHHSHSSTPFHCAPLPTEAQTLLAVPDLKSTAMAELHSNVIVEPIFVQAS